MWVRKFLSVLLVLALVSLPALSQDTYFEEMSQLIDQADKIIAQQAQELEQASQQLKKLTLQLTEQSEVIKKQQQSFKRCVICSGVLIAALTATVMIVEIKR